MQVLLFAFSIVFLISGCSKTPESQTAVEIGKQPKQIVDKVTTDVNKAMQKDAEQRQQAEKKE